MSQTPGGESGALPAGTGAEIIDAVFAICCPCLPVDHAFALSQAIQAELPWFAAEPGAGLHTVHGAASGSGWMRPEGEDAVLQLSRRARLALRLPLCRLDDAAALVGRTLDIAGHALRIDKLAPRPLSRVTTLYSRCVLMPDCSDEIGFLRAAAAQLEAYGIRPPSVLCGRMTPLATPARTYETRSLMLAGLTREQSLAMQREGLGDARTLGCGVFIPHKDIADLRPGLD